MYFLIQVLIVSMAFSVCYKNESAEYRHVGSFFANLLFTLRVSLGDFDFEFNENMTKADHRLFWIIWGFVIILTCVVFLTFVIAMVCDTHSDIKTTIDQVIYKERAELIREAE